MRTSPNDLVLAPISIRNGWRIVAVEQAEESVPLQDFVFPPKTLLLLGKEREGVPVELLNKVQLFWIQNPPNPNTNLRWMIVWRSLRAVWSVPSTSMSLVPLSSGRQSSSCPSCRRYLDFVVLEIYGPCRSCLREACLPGNG